MAYGANTDITISFSASGNDHSEITQLFAGFSLRKFAPIVGADYNGARMNTWGVVKDAFNVRFNSNSVNFETDGVPLNAIESISKRFPKARFRLEYCSDNGNYHGFANIYNGKAKDWRFKGVGVVSFDKNCNLLQSGSLVYKENDKTPYIYKGLSSLTTDDSLFIEAQNISGDIFHINQSEVEWRPCC